MNTKPSNSDPKDTGQQCFTDWSKCFLCQKNTNEKLVCPARSNNETSGYDTIAANILEFDKLGCIPYNIR